MQSSLLAQCLMLIGQHGLQAWPSANKKARGSRREWWVPTAHLTVAATLVVHTGNSSSCSDSTAATRMGGGGCYMKITVVSVMHIPAFCHSLQVIRLNDIWSPTRIVLYHYRKLSFTLRLNDSQVKHVLRGWHSIWRHRTSSRQGQGLKCSAG